MCPSTCGTYSACVDPSTRLKFNRESSAATTLTRSCIWVANKSTAECCNIDEMIDACCRTCDNC